MRLVWGLLSFCLVALGAAAPTAAAPGAPFYVLAISWQPAFCETSPRKRECRSQTAARADAGQFSLHGLWPQPSSRQYCDVTPAVREASKSGQWRDIPDLDLSLRTRAALEELMPGSQSYLDRHEWAKHGSCYPVADPETYFRDSLRLVQAINDSGLAELMRDNIGRRLSASEIRAQFDEAFGEGAGERVRVACRDDGNRRLITELTIGLKGDIPGGTPLSKLMLAAPPVGRGCPDGIVDPAGQQ